jgi:hypothetical protein
MDEARQGPREVDPNLRSAVLIVAVLGFIQGALIGLVLALLYVLW